MLSNIRTFSATCLGLALCALPAVSSLAQPAELATAQSVWEHELSSLRIPSQITGFRRGESYQFDDEGFNVSIRLSDEATGTSADVYVYRAGIASVPIWSDRAATSMLSSGSIGTPDLDDIIITTFTPPSEAGENSGQRIVAGVTGEFTATGMAIYLHDGWLIKARMTSRTLDSETLDIRLAGLMAELNLNTATRQAPAFVGVEYCEDVLEIRREAKLMRLDMMASLLIGVAVGTAREKAAEDDEDRAPAIWCRDSVHSSYGVYRNGGDDDSYTMAMGDSGTSLSVGRFNLGQLVRPSRGFLVTQSDGVTAVTYPPFDRLPNHSVVAAIPGNLSPISTFDERPGSDGSHTIIVPAQE